MIINKTCIGRNVKIVGKHPHTGQKGIVEGFYNTLAGYGLKIKLEDGESCFVFKQENLKFI